MADAAADVEAHGGAGLQTAKDLFSGAVGGMAQVLLGTPFPSSLFLPPSSFLPNPSTLALPLLTRPGQPFDIVKVRLQTTTAYPSALSAATSIYKNEGPSAFYKGTLTPLIGIGACVSIQFGAFHQARRWFEGRSANPGAPLPYSQYFASGAFAGIANSVLSGPIEHVRIRMQTQPHGAGRLYTGPLDCLRKMGAASGGSVLRGAYRGGGVTVWREAFAYGFWFQSFEYMMNADARRNGVDRKDIPSYKIALWGGIAGEALWLGSYPFDVVKSKMQTDGFGEARKYKSAIDCFAQTFKVEGARGFWRGIAPTLMRAAPVSAGTFVVVELTMKVIN
ncbi:MC/SLC25 family protein [Candidatus Bathyarchaeota archaeon]|nr:MC/SLC25 family protein [Candidatus Bathyarchaeota archaeon]